LARANCFLIAAGLERVSADYKGESRERRVNELRNFLSEGAEPLPAHAELAVRLLFCNAASFFPLEGVNNEQLNFKTDSHIHEY
jgi:hypothetical protein